MQQLMQQTRRNNLQLKVVTTRISSDRRRQAINPSKVTKTVVEVGEVKIEAMLKVDGVAVAEETTHEEVGAEDKSKAGVAKEVDEASKITMDVVKDPRRPPQDLPTMPKEVAIKNHRKINNMVNKAITTKNHSTANLPRFTQTKDTTNLQGVDRIIIAGVAVIHTTTTNRTLINTMGKRRDRRNTTTTMERGVAKTTDNNSINNHHLMDTTMIDKDNR